MKVSHREEQRGDRLVDVLTDEEHGLRVTVSRLGAELISLAKKNESGDWIGLLYRDNDISAPVSGWANHATVMGYYLHRLKDGRSFYRGHEIKGGTHSFLRSKIWHRIENEDRRETSLTYRITPRDFLPTDYPLKVSLDLTYEFVGDSIGVIFQFRNDEPDLAAHVGFGLHPGFAATSFHSFRFHMPAGKYRRHFSPDNYLSGETEDIEFSGGEMPFPREQLPGSYILELVDVPNREFIFSDPPSRRGVVLDLSGAPYLTLWSDGGPFFCAEPCWGLTDHQQQRAFEEKEGIQEIPPQAELIRRFSMRPRLEASC
jgi:galactose mutarotase-like enzyme